MYIKAEQITKKSFYNSKKFHQKAYIINKKKLAIYELH